MPTSADHCHIRRCVSCRRLAAKADFWRIVRLYPSQAIVLDVGMGRSAYLCPEAACLQVAQRKNRLAKALKAPVPDALYEQLWQRLQTPPEPAVMRATGQRLDA